MAHPLSGADLRTLNAILREAGPGVDGKRLARIRASVLGRVPLTLTERLFQDRLALPSSAVKAPIFILGHWRSGTTHLYNILNEAGFGTVSPIAAGLPHELLTLGRGARPLLEKALPEGRYIDKVPVTPTSPQEDEPAIANMTRMSFYHALYFPARFDFFLDRGLFFDHASEGDVAEWEAAFTLLMRKLAAYAGQPLLVKNPVYTARPAHLLKLFPDARFIHIYRDPYDVFLSMRNFYEKLLGVMALQPYDHVDIDGAIIRTYARMMGDFEAQTAGWAAPRFIELSYAELEKDPIGAVAGIYHALNLDGFAEAEPSFRRYLGGVASYEKNRFERDREAEAKIEEAWAPWMSRYRAA